MEIPRHEPPRDLRAPRRSLMIALAVRNHASPTRALPTRLVVAELRALILEVRRSVPLETSRHFFTFSPEASTDPAQLDDSVLDTSRSSTWITVRQFFVRTVNAIDAAQPVRRVAEALRDLEASFLITSQRDAWLEGERSEWLDLVRAMSRVDQSIDRFGLLRSIGYLLNDLAMSVKTEAYRSVFVRRDADGVCRKTTWHMRLETILNLGVDARDTESQFEFDAEISASAVGLVRPSQVARAALGASYDASTDALMRWQTVRRQNVENVGTLRRVIDASNLRTSDNDSDDPYSNVACAQEELISLREEVSRLRLAREHEVLCTICYTNKRDTVVCPCLHLMYCNACISRVHEAGSEDGTARCPHCRAQMTATMRIFS